MPPVVTRERNDEIAELNAAWSKIADSGSAVVMDSTKYLSTAGSYLERGLVNDELRRLRNIDGLHLCPGGAIRLADPLLLTLRERYGLVAVAGWQDTDWAEGHFVPEECPEPE